MRETTQVCDRVTDRAPDDLCGLSGTVIGNKEKSLDLNIHWTYETDLFADTGDFFPPICRAPSHLALAHMKTGLDISVGAACFYRFDIAYLVALGSHLVNMSVPWARALLEV